MVNLVNYHANLQSIQKQESSGRASSKRKLLKYVSFKNGPTNCIFLIALRIQL